MVFTLLCGICLLAESELHGSSSLLDISLLQLKIIFSPRNVRGETIIVIHPRYTHLLNYNAIRYAVIPIDHLLHSSLLPFIDSFSKNYFQTFSIFTTSGQNTRTASHAM